MAIMGAAASSVAAAPGGFCDRHPDHWKCKQPPPSGTVLFADEFDGVFLDGSKWWATPWCSTSVDDSYGCYSDRNVFLNGAGQLVLRISAGTMGRPVDFARVQTFREGGWPPPEVLWKHGPPFRVESRVRFGAGPGVWGAVWSMANASSAANLELDTQEYRGALPFDVTCHTHIMVEWGATVRVPFDGAQGFHTYWSEYRADRVTFGVDGLTCGSVALPAATEQMLRFSNVVGPPDHWGGIGGPPDPALYPIDMHIDYVRVTSL